VILPTYQRRELVRRAVASALAQTYRDFELIVVDDGSTDGTGEALAPLGDRIRYEWQPNRGVAAARNLALRLATGSILAFLDSDDQWLPNHLAVVTDLLRRHPEAVAASTCPGKDVRGRHRLTDARIEDYRHEPNATRGTIGFVSCMAVRAEALARVGGFDERLKAGEDTDLRLKLATVGPYCLLRRRTVRRQYTSGGLKDRGLDSGAYLAAARIQAANLTEAAARLPRPARAKVEREAHGLLYASRVRQALEHHDTALVGADLEQACRHLPLSDEPRQAERHLGLDVARGHRPEKQLRELRTLLELWPEKDSPTEHYLRARSAVMALRCRMPREAVRLLGRWRARGTLRFAMRAIPLIYHRVRKALQDRRDQAREVAALR
jgi:hypothetical protein